MPFNSPRVSRPCLVSADGSQKILRQRIFPHEAQGGWFAGLKLMSLASLPAYGQCGTTWVGPAMGGLWNGAANWSAGVPTASTNVCFDNGNSAVTLNIAGAQAANLTITGGDSLSFNNATSLTVSGSSISNAGNIVLNSTGNFTEFIIGAPNVTLNGGGSVTMSNNANNYIFGATGTDTLTNQETVSGAGHIGNGQLTLVNSSIINSNDSAGLTIQTSGGTTNTGTIEATAGSVLTLTSSTVTNTGATISANGGLDLINSTINGGAVTLTGASTVQLTNGVIHSGSTLTNSTTGTIEALAGTSTLGGTINNSGTLKIDNGAALDVENGTYSKLGKVTMNSAGNVTELVVAGPNVTLSGGSVTMSNNANNLEPPEVKLSPTASNINLNGAAAKFVDAAGKDVITKISNITSTGAFGITGRAFTTVGNFTNNGTLTVGSGSKFVVNGNLTNFSWTTLKGGTYAVMGTLQFNGANIVNNAAAITLSSTASKVHRAAKRQ